MEKEIIYIIFGLMLFVFSYIDYKKRIFHNRSGIIVFIFSMAFLLTFEVNTFYLLFQFFVMFVFAQILFNQDYLGAGDSKLIFLMTPLIPNFWVFLIFMLLFILVLELDKNTEERAFIPFILLAYTVSYSFYTI